MKNLGSITHDKDIITKEYLENKIQNLVSRASVRVTETTDAVDIPIIVTNTSNLLVYHNGLLLEPEFHYNIVDNVLHLLDYYANIGDLISFIYIT